MRKGKKRFLSLFMAVALIFSLLVPASAVEVSYAVEGGNIYFDAETGTVTGCDESVTAADIPAKINGTAVTAIGSHAFDSCYELTKVTLPEGLVTIEEYAFFCCNGLTEVILPEGLTTIGDYAFQGCYVLTDVTLPESLTTIGGLSFAECFELTDVILPEGLTTIGDGAFMSCALTEALFPESLTTIGSSAFEDCDGLTEVMLPEGITAIGESVFANCDGLTKVVFPDGLTTIGEYAFANCIALTDIVFPAGLIEIGNWAFDNCNALLTVTLPENLRTIGCSAFNTCDALENVTLPESLTTIGDNAFSGCDSLAEVALPSSIIDFGSDVFADCNALTTVTMAEGLTEIGNAAFYCCDSLTEVTLPESLTTIGEYAFYDCDSLTEVLLPESLTTIGNSAFGYCDGLTKVMLPESLTTIGDEAFYGCESLAEVTVPGSIIDFGSLAFDCCPALTAITMAEDLTVIGDFAFSDCDSLVEVTIPGSIIDFGSGAFANCPALTTVTMAEGLTEIGSEAFSGCNSLTEVTLPESLTTILSYAFYNCGSLTEVTLPEGLTTILGDAFWNCDSITEVTFPESLTTIGDSAFYDCDALTEVTLPDSLTTIGAGAFSGCASLTEVIVPGSITDFGWYAFSTCYALTTVTMEEGLTTIGNYAFAYCPGLTSITIPTSLETIGDYAFTYSGLTDIVIPEGVTSIGWHAFDHSNLVSVVLPESLTFLDEFAFYNCTSLTDVTLTGGAADAYAAFQNCSALMSAVVCEGNEELSQNIFADCTSLTTVTLPFSLTEIREGAFSGCSNLTDVYYAGTQEAWNAIVIHEENEPLAYATIHYGSEPPVNPPAGPDPDADYTVSNIHFDENGNLWFDAPAVENADELGYDVWFKNSTGEWVYGGNNQWYDGVHVFNIGYDDICLNLETGSYTGVQVETIWGRNDENFGEVLAVTEDETINVVVSLENMPGNVVFTKQEDGNYTAHADMQEGILAWLSFARTPNGDSHAAYGHISDENGWTWEGIEADHAEGAYYLLEGYTDAAVFPVASEDGKSLSYTKVTYGDWALVEDSVSEEPEYSLEVFPAALVAMHTELPDEDMHITCRCDFNEDEWEWTFRILDGMLPNGITINDEGYFIGFTTESGIFPVTVTVSATNGTQTLSDTGRVWVFSFGILNQQLPSAKVGEDYSAVIDTYFLRDLMKEDAAQDALDQMTEEEKAALYEMVETIKEHFILSAGSLPQGLELNELTGEISGIPAESGDFPITVELVFCEDDEAIGIPYSPYDFVLHVDPEEVPHIHIWDDGVVTTEPTCTEEGVRTYTCECGETRTEAIAALGHIYDDDRDAECNRCGAVREIAHKECTVSILTASLEAGIRYVPYAAKLQIGYVMDECDSLRFSVTDGKLPEGVTLNQRTGELSGIPMNAGTFSFTVNVDVVCGKTNETLASAEREFSLIVTDNTVEEIEEKNDYEIKERLPEVIDQKEEVVDQNFSSTGELEEFTDLWLDGKKLERAADQAAWDNGEGDYIATSGSTILTIRAKVFEDLEPGTHTIVAEFRAVNTEEPENVSLKRTAQNFTVEGAEKKPSGGGSSKPAVRPVEKPEKPKTVADIFTDVAESDWFFGDVEWAYQKGLMIGVSDVTYEPMTLISPAMVVATLARLDGVDLHAYAESAYADVENGQWYTAAAVWARKEGILSEEDAFSALPPMVRARFAVMLVNYLKNKGIDCALPEEMVTFADAALMTEEENAAFQVLYKLGIFKGVGNYDMDAQGSTTRAQLAALLHRVSAFVEQ